MRIIHFVPYYPPERIGGVGEFVAALHEGLLQRGQESVVVTAGRRSTPPIHRIARSRLGWFLGSLLWLRRAASSDIVHGQAGESLPLLLALRLLPGRHARILATFHSSTAKIQAAERPYEMAGHPLHPRRGGGLAARVRSQLHEAIDRITLHLADACNTISRSTAVDLLGPRQAAAARVIYNGVVVSAPGAANGANPVELLYVGVARACKRPAALPFVLAAVRREIPTARLRIVGFDLADEPELKSLFEETGTLAHVDCVGPRTGPELPAYYRSAKVLVLPSAHEGLPYVLLEALANGVPVVASRVGGHPEVIEDGDNGFMVGVDQPDEFAERCIRILRDPDLAERFSRAGRETVERRFGLERQIDAYLDYYRELCNAGAEATSS